MHIMGDTNIGGLLTINNYILYLSFIVVSVIVNFCVYIYIHINILIYINLKPFSSTQNIK